MVWRWRRRRDAAAFGLVAGVVHVAGGYSVFRRDNPDKEQEAMNQNGDAGDAGHGERYTSQRASISGR